MSLLRIARILTIAAVPALSLVANSSSASAAPMPSPPGYSEDVFSFYMWCLEMQLYPASRCDVRQPNDVKDYQRYRADVEKERQARSEKIKRDQQILDKVNRDPLNKTRN